MAVGGRFSRVALAYRFGVLPCDHTVSEIEEAEGVLPRLTLRFFLEQRPMVRGVSVLKTIQSTQETNVGATASKYQAHGHPPAQHGR